MQVVGQQDDGVDGERVKQPAACDRPAQQYTSAGLGEEGSATLGHEGEKERAARPKHSDVVGHGGCFIRRELAIQSDGGRVRPPYLLISCVILSAAPPSRKNPKSQRT